MKKILALLLVTTAAFTSCNNDEDDKIQAENPLIAQTTFSFSHNWNDEPIVGTDMEITNYTTDIGQNINIGPRFRYIISDITFTEMNSGESIVLDGYNLVDVGTDTNLTYTPEETIPTGEYNVSFTYGLTTEKNVDGIYQDLNSASFGVPLMLGGGYHYMQLDGKYINNAGVQNGFNYHNIRAVDPDMTNGPSFPDQPTFINVDLGVISITNNATIEVKMNVAEWFTGPNRWDLNVFNQMLMGNSSAQKMMNENGQNVFSLGEVTP